MQRRIKSDDKNKVECSSINARVLPRRKHIFHNDLSRFVSYVIFPTRYLLCFKTYILPARFYQTNIIRTRIQLPSAMNLSKSVRRPQAPLETHLATAACVWLPLQLTIHRVHNVLPKELFDKFRTSTASREHR